MLERILICGSTFLTARCCEALLRLQEYELVGYVPNSQDPTVPGKMTLPVADPSLIVDGPQDIILSIQYDRKILTDLPAFNVHTGLLPEWGGSDILYHTLKEGVHEQGATFHRITERFDSGPILSKITYPVFEEDTIVSLYRRLAAVVPGFVIASLALLKVVGIQDAERCVALPPRLFRRGQIAERDLDLYRKTPALLRAEFSS